MWLPYRKIGRKVRAPEDSVMGNTHPLTKVKEDQSHRDEFSEMGSELFIAPIEMKQ